MDLTQERLTKSEWDYLEVPVNPGEKTILNLIYNGYDNSNYTHNDSNSLLGWMKIGTEDESFHLYMYQEYFKKTMDNIIKTYELEYSICEKKKKPLKKLRKKDLIRIKNSSKKLSDMKDSIYEFILLNNIRKFFKKNSCPKRYYTLTQLIKNNVTHINSFVLNFVKFVIEHYKLKINKVNLV